MKCEVLIDWLTFSVKSTKDPAEVIFMGWLCNYSLCSFVT